MPAAKKAAKKAPAKKAATKDVPVVEEEQAPELAPTNHMEGVEYENGYMGESQDDEDYSLAAQVAKLAQSE